MICKGKVEHGPDMQRKRNEERRKGKARTGYDSRGNGEAPRSNGRERRSIDTQRKGIELSCIVKIYI